MPSQAWKANDFIGLTPAIDPRRSDKFFVLNGENFVFDSKGPKSDFGNRWLSPFGLGKPEHVQGFRLKLKTGDRVVVMTREAMLEWREDLGGWKYLYVFPRPLAAARWTQGYLNGIQYFCHPSTGLLAMPVDTGFVQPVNSPGTPESPISICVNNGRLCAIDEDYFYHSATSNGLDWTPRLGGAGFFKIADRVSGSPIQMTSYTKGIFVWTTGGVMRAEFTGDEVVFRYRALVTELRPINSFCTMQTDMDTAVILDERGLFQTRGELPTPLTPLFNEFLIEYLQDFDLAVGQNVRVEWDDLQRRMYVSVSLSFESATYENCFVLYPSVDKWGQFNEHHFGILPVAIGAGSRAGRYFGFVDSKGRCRYWNGGGSREVTPVDTSLDGVSFVQQKPVHQGDGAVVFSSTARAGTTPRGDYSGVTGYFPAGGGLNAAPAVVGLSATVQLGLLRVEVGESNEQLTEVVNIAIGSAVMGDAQNLAGKFSLMPVFLGESFGLQTPNYVNHGLRVVSTIDGASIFDSCVPSLETSQRAMRHFSCSTVGIWHIVELTAMEVGEAFHVQSVELTVVDAGTL